MMDFLKSQSISYSAIYFLINESRHTCLGGFVVMDILEILPGLDIKQALSRHSQTNVISVKHGNGNYKLDKTRGIGIYMLSWLQYGQDRNIDKLHKGKTNGFFVEIGVPMESGSQTHYFWKKGTWMDRFSSGSKPI